MKTLDYYAVTVRYGKTAGEERLWAVSPDEARERVVAIVRPLNGIVLRVGKPKDVAYVR